MPDRSPKAISFAGYVLDVCRGCVRAGQAEIRLRPKSFAILCHLVGNAGRIVTKDELFKIGWPRVVVTDDSLTRCISDIRAALDDGTRRIVRTIPKRGYLFAAPVTVDAGWMEAAKPARQPGEFGLSARRLQGRGGLSVAVLPFASHGAGSDGSALASIISDGVAASLLHLAGAHVVGGASAAQDRGGQLDPCRIARNLGVGYVLTGSEQHDATRIRVAVHLIDGATGRYVWADEFEVSRTDPFAVRDFIVRRLARALHVELTVAEADRLVLDPITRDTDVLALRGEAIFLRYGVVREEAEEAYVLCERALQLDPDNVRALAILSEKFSTRVTSIQSSDPAADIERAEALACQAATIDASSPHAHYARARVLIAQKRPDAAMDEATHSLTLNPNFVPAYLGRCQAHLYLGEPKACIEDGRREWHCTRSTRMSPFSMRTRPTPASCVTMTGAP